MIKSVIAEVAKFYPEASEQGEADSVVDVKDVGFGGTYLL